MVYIVVTLIAYLIGSISFSVVFSKKFAGVDVREKGSKNAGTTNVLRVVGKKAAIITLICDILKGSVAVLVAFIIAKMFTVQNGALLVQLSAVAVILGHTFPIFFQFKGGKGIATALGALFVLNYQIALICLIFALLLMVLTKMVSVGSLGAAVLFPVLIMFLSDKFIIPGDSYLISGIAIAILIIFNHRANVQRLMNGTENKISFKK